MRLLGRWLRSRWRKADGAAHAQPIERELVLVCVEWRGHADVLRGLSPQDAAGVSTRFSQAVARVARSRAGLECDAGAHAITLAFGADVSSARACRQALLAACDIERALFDLAAQWRRDFGFACDVAVCVVAGGVTLAGAHAPASHRRVATGPAIDALSRLRLQAAREGVFALVATDVLRRGGVSFVRLARLGMDVSHETLALWTLLPVGTLLHL